MDAIEYFKGMRKRLCEDHLKLLPKKSVGYQATLREMSFYDADEVERVFKAVDEINELISDCEEYQESNDSAYHKEQEKVIVYDKIVEILKGGE